MIKAETALLGPGLMDVLSTALPLAAGRLRGLRYEEHPALLPLLTRAEVRRLLTGAALPPGWTLEGDSRKMEELRLCNKALGLDLRLLKERRRSYPGGVPPAGPNPSRRLAWTGPSIDSMIPGLVLPSGEQAPVRRVDLLLVWDLIKAGVVDGGFTLRVVHTTAPGTFGRAVPLDLDLVLRPGGTIFDRGEFKGDPQDIDLFGGASEVELGEADSDD